MYQVVKGVVNPKARTIATLDAVEADFQFVNGSQRQTKPLNPNGYM